MPDRPAPRPPPALPRGRALFLRALAVLVFLPAGLACLAVPVLFGERQWGGLLDDTMALFGAGTTEGAPVATSVSCVERNTGGGSRSLRSRDWVCVIDLAVPRPPAAAPARPLTAMEQVEDNLRRLAERRAQPGGGYRLERVLASNRNGEMPEVRRLSAGGEPARFGLVWGPGELAWRWAQSAFLFGLVFGLGFGLLWLVWFIWRRTAASR